MHNDSTSASSKRLFKADDNGADYWFVASSIDHANKVIAEAGVDWTADADKKYGATPVEWSELSADDAAKVRCNTNEDDRGRGTIPLTECDLGEWFCSEY